VTLSPPVHLMRLVPAELFANDINQRYVSTVPMDLEHASLIANVAWAIADCLPCSQDPICQDAARDSESRTGSGPWVIRMCG